MADHEHIPDHIWATFPPAESQAIVDRINEYGGPGVAIFRVDIRGLHGPKSQVKVTVSVEGDDGPPINESQIHPPP